MDSALSHCSFDFLLLFAFPSLGRDIASQLQSSSPFTLNLFLCNTPVLSFFLLCFLSQSCRATARCQKHKYQRHLLVRDSDTDGEKTKNREDGKEKERKKKVGAGQKRNGTTAIRVCPTQRARRCLCLCPFRRSRVSFAA